MFVEFFVFFGLWWWILFSAFVIANIFFLENDNGKGATFIFAAFLAIMFFFGDWNPFPAMMADPLWAVQLVLGYFVGGAVWAVAKWYFYGLNLRDEYRLVKEQFFSREGIVGDKIPQDLVGRWENTIFSNFPMGVPPKAKENKASILMWMTHWPFSFVWTILNDPIRRIFMFVYSRIVGLMQKISDRIFKNEIVEYDDN